MRPGRLSAAAAAVLVLLATSCAGDDPTRQPEGEVAPTVPERTAPVPAALERFLDRAAGATGASFTATWDVRRKLVGTRSTVVVRSAPPAASITVGPLQVFTGPTPASCRSDAQACVGQLREEALVPYGLFSGFFSTGPAQALRSLAAREDAAAPVFSTDAAAGLDLDCAGVPVEQAVTTTACINADGVFAVVDNPSVAYRLTEYRRGPPTEAVEPPFPIQTDDEFLLQEP